MYGFQAVVKVTMVKTAAVTALVRMELLVITSMDLVTAYRVLTAQTVAMVRDQW